MISVDNTALEMLKKLLGDNPNVLGIKVSLENKGCSGQSYKFDYVTEEPKNCEKVVFDNVALYIDFSATLYLFGSRLVWLEDKFQSRFDFENPNENNRCGCGESINLY